jgi:hypothetical protein
LNSNLRVRNNTLVQYEASHLDMVSQVQSLQSRMEEQDSENATHVSQLQESNATLSDSLQQTSHLNYEMQTEIQTQREQLESKSEQLSQGAFELTEVQRRAQQDQHDLNEQIEHLLK